MDNTNSKNEGLFIPYQKLSQSILEKVIEDFVTREGTDYGDGHFSLEDKIAKVKQQLVSGKVGITFNSEDESCYIVPIKS
jgi:uncharacterized protein